MLINLILRNWDVGMPLDKPEVDVLPIWIQFPNLPLDLWTTEALSILASHVGVPLFDDRTTSEQSRLGHARVCVEIRVEDELFDEMTVRYASGQEYTQRVVYEWVPFKCSKCKKFGHGDVACKVVQKYRPVFRQVHRCEAGKGKDVADGVLSEGVPVVQGGDADAQVSGYNSPSLPMVQQAGQHAVLQQEEGVSAAIVGAKLTYASMVVTPTLHNNKKKGGSKGSGDVSLTSGGSHPPAIAMKEFNDCVDMIDVTNFTSHGCMYTWRSNWKDRVPSVRKLDYVFCNEEWLACFPQGSCHSSYGVVVEMAWQLSGLSGSPLDMLLRKFKATKSALSGLNKEHFSNLGGDLRLVEVKDAFHSMVVRKSPGPEELVQGYHKEDGVPRAAIKVDLQKAYDMVEWDSLWTEMLAMGFPQRFVFLL
ncbi:hypothetical protein LIER_25573 [Lithospermum erythrorhizon]|uniref:DUF4283 domain-containing protein n=1 Tax=Lithospermum erythrorhizon TaxID=34254 RepID=A0AAV3R8Z5_LITER